MNRVCSGSIFQLRRRARTGQSACGAGIVKRTWSRSKCSRDPAGQTEVFVPVPLLHTFNWIYSYRQLAVRIVVSAIAVFWLVDDVIAVFRLITDIITNSTRLQTQIVTRYRSVADNTCSGVIHCLQAWTSVANRPLYIDRQLNNK